MRDKELLNQDKRQHFFVRDINFLSNEGTIYVLNLSRREMGMVFQTGVQKQAPLSLQLPVFKNGGAFVSLPVVFISTIKTYDSESRGQEEPVTTE